MPTVSPIDTLLIYVFWSIYYIFIKKKAGSDVRYLQGDFTCPECEKPFRNLHNLRRHALTKHGLNSADLAEAVETSNMDSEGKPMMLAALAKKPRPSTAK